MLMPVTVLVLLLPATSLAFSLVTLWFAPSPDTSLSVGQCPTPEPALPSVRAGSEQVKPTVTSPRYQSAAFFPAGSWAVMDSGVRSILIPVTEPVPSLPALSLILPEAPRLRPLPVIVLLAGWVAGSMSDSPSVPVQTIETSPRYHSPPLESPVGAPVSDGAVLSMLMSFTVVELLLPATSWVSPLTDWPVPSLATVWSGPQPAIPSVTSAGTPESASVHSKVTLTSVLFQPNELAAGVRSAAMVGGIVSTFTSTVFVLALTSSLPARSALQ